jgi:hypothetical protein
MTEQNFRLPGSDTGQLRAHRHHDRRHAANHRHVVTCRKEHEGIDGPYYFLRQQLGRLYHHLALLAARETDHAHIVWDKNPRGNLEK